MPAQKKIDLKESYDELLKENPDFILTRFSGLNVEKMSDLRRKLLEKNAPYRIVKNNIFKRAIVSREDIKDFPVDDQLVGPLGIAFVREDVPSVAKVLKDFAKENEEFSMVSGVMESKFYDESGMKSVADMPSKEESLATLMAALQGPATNIASLMNQVITQLARGIKAVGEKNG